MIPTQRVIDLGAAENDSTGDALRIGGFKINENNQEIYGAFGINTINVNIYNPITTGGGATDLSNIITLLSNTINNASPEINVVKSSLFRVQYSTDTSVVQAVYSFSGGFNSYGSGLTQTTTEQFTLIGANPIDSSIDPNDLDSAVTIQESINNGGVKYITADRNIFRRTINGEVRVFAYTGNEDCIGTGSGFTTLSSDYVDITGNGQSLSVVPWDNVTISQFLEGYPFFENNQTAQGALTGISLLNVEFLQAFGVPYTFDNLNRAFYSDESELFTNQNVQIADRLYFNFDTREILRYLGTTNGDATDYEVQVLSTGGGNGGGIDLSSIQSFQSLSDATTALGVNQMFLWDFDNIDGVPSPNGSQLGITK